MIKEHEILLFYSVSSLNVRDSIFNCLQTSVHFAATVVSFSHHDDSTIVRIPSPWGASGHRYRSMKYPTTFTTFPVAVAHRAFRQRLDEEGKQLIG